MKKTTSLKLALPLGLMSALLMSCEVKLQQADSEGILQTQMTSGLATLKVDVNRYASNKLVCDPFETPQTTTTTTYEQGIMASLHYLDNGMPRMYKAGDYIQFGRKSDKSIFLADMNVRTRMFTEGFSTPSGEVLKKDSGEKLIEFFGLKMTTNIVLAADDEPGLYELAFLADDGSKLILKSGDGDGADEVLIDNDGDHPTRMGCANRVIRMDRHAMQAVEVQYYQGPRYHIANVLMWRKATTAGEDPSCGKLGNHMYFNPDQNSAPQQAFIDLQARGWKVLKPENYMISKTKIDYNPCTKGTAPVITDFREIEIGQTVADFRWTTDIPATSQLQLTNMSTGAVTTTVSDNQLRTDHHVSLSNLQPNTEYRVQAISVSEDLGRTISNEIIIQTQ